MHKIPFLNIKNLGVSVGKIKILKNFNLKINFGEIHAIMGPNGSGKSTLSRVLAGDPNYTIDEGKIIFEGINITHLEPEHRSNMGIFLAFQYPVEIPGVRNEDFLRLIYNTKEIIKGNREIDPLNFLTIIYDKLKTVNMSPNFLNRNVNEGFSGGEKKRNEILQMLLLESKLSILDETDSGLDIDSLKSIAKSINHFICKNRSLILITHYQRLLDYVRPDFVHVMYKGKIIKTGDYSLSKILELNGYKGLT